jgi:hypothetical protein
VPLPKLVSSVAGTEVLISPLASIGTANVCGTTTTRFSMSTSR